MTGGFGFGCLGFLESFNLNNHLATTLKKCATIFAMAFWWTHKIYPPWNRHRPWKWMVGRVYFSFRKAHFQRVYYWLVVEPTLLKKNVRQIGSFPHKNRDENEKIFELPPPRSWFLFQAWVVSRILEWHLLTASNGTFHHMQQKKTYLSLNNWKKIEPLKLMILTCSWFFSEDSRKPGISYYVHPDRIPYLEDLPI